MSLKSQARKSQLLKVFIQECESEAARVAYWFMQNISQ